MPANLTPDYRRAEQAFKEAVTPEERIAALEEMLAVIPKHKGTDKLQGDLKKRLSKLRNKEDKKGGKKGDPFKIPMEGGGRAVLVGAPNSGKSALVDALTNAAPEVAPYPFTTLKPSPGMMPFEDIQLQLIDTAPVTKDRVEVYHSNLARSADLILCVIDLGADDPADQFKEVFSVFESKNICFVPEMPENSHAYGIAEKKTIIVANKYDLDEDDILLGHLMESIEIDLRIIPVSATENMGLEELRKVIFAEMDIVRIYSKIPGKPADMNSPFTLPAGSTVQDVARTVHKDIEENLRYARIWGSERFDGQQVQRDYVVHDKDIIELHVL